MADNTPARKSRRPPRGGRSLGAIRKGVEGNATTATARSGTREPLLNKQTPAYNDDWDEDDWGDSHWGDNGVKSAKPYHQPQSFNGNHTLPYSSPPRSRPGGGGSGRLSSLGNRGRTCVTAMVVVMLLIGVSFTISGSRYRGRSRETQKTIIKSSTTQHEDSQSGSTSNKSNNKKPNRAAAVDNLNDFQETPHLEEETKSAKGGSHLHDWDLENDVTSDPGSDIAVEIDEIVDYENEDDPESNIDSAAHLEDDQQQQGIQQYETDYDADYDTSPRADKTGDNGGEEDNSELVDSRGWAGEDVGAAAEENFFEGDGSFSDGDDIAEIRVEEELEDEEDYASPVEGADGEDDGEDDELEEGEETHFLGTKPDEKPLTGGQDWEGDNAAALINEGEGEERDADGGGNGGGDYEEEETYGEEEEQQEQDEGESEYDYEGNLVESRKESSFSDATQLHPHDSTITSRTTGAGQKAAGGGGATIRRAGASTQSQKPASGTSSALSKSSSLEDSELASDFNILDLENVDPFTAEKLIEQQEIKELESEDGAGAFSSARRGGSDNDYNNDDFDFLDSSGADEEYSNVIGFNELATRGDSSTTTAEFKRAGAVAGKSNPTSTGAATDIIGGQAVQKQPNQVRNEGIGTIPRASNAKQGAGAGGGADSWNEDYADDEQHFENEEEEPQQDLDYSAGEDAATVPKIEGVGDASLRPVNTAATGAKKTAAGATTQNTATSSRSGATTSTRTTPTSTAGNSSGVNKQQGHGKLVASGSGTSAQQQQVQQKIATPTSASTAASKAKSAAASNSTSTVSSVTKQQGSASAGKNTAMASSEKSSISSGAVKKTNATSTSTVTGEARNRRAGSAGGVLPGHGGEEAPEDRIEPVKVGATKPGEKPSFAEATEIERDSSSTSTARTSSSGTTTTSSSNKPVSKTASSSLGGAADGGHVASVLPVAPKNTAEAMIRSQKLDEEEEEESYNNEKEASARGKTLPAAGVGDDAEKEEMEKVDAVKSSKKSPPASSGSKSRSEKTSVSSSPKQAATSSSPGKSSTSSKPSSSVKKPKKGKRRSLRSDLPVVRLKKHPQPYGEEDQQKGEGNQRRKRQLPN